VVAQTTQAFENVPGVLTAAGCAMTDVVRFPDLPHPRHRRGRLHAGPPRALPTLFSRRRYPPNTLLIISRLVKPELLVEIEAMAVKPAKTAAPPRAKAKPARRTRAKRRR